MRNIPTLTLRHCSGHPVHERLTVNIIDYNIVRARSVVQECLGSGCCAKGAVLGHDIGVMWPDRENDSTTRPLRIAVVQAVDSNIRSEEHTSELQSLAYLVC